MEELSDFALDKMYVDENVLTNTDRILEDHMTGSLRAWHLILIVAGGVMVAGKVSLDVMWVIKTDIFLEGPSFSSWQ